jgi:hypothetical protein
MAPKTSRREDGKIAGQSAVKEPALPKGPAARDV